MTVASAGQPTPGVGIGSQITRAFPRPGRLVQSAYRDLQLAQFGSEEAQAVLGRPEDLDRPWDPPSCSLAVRRQVWVWLDEVAAWVNHEYGWGVDRLIPPCWPAHPHIAHELATLAHQRHTAGLALSGELLEEWQRYSLPMFLDRLAGQLGNRCVNGHDEWPAASRYRTFTTNPATADREARFDDDCATPPRRLALVDLNTAEVTDVPDIGSLP
jgi:hypothetical protein